MSAFAAPASHAAFAGMQKHPSSIKSLTIVFISETNADAPKAISAPKGRLGVPDVLVNGGGANGGLVEALMALVTKNTRQASLPS